MKKRLNMKENIPGKKSERKNKTWIIWLLIIIFLLVVLWALGTYTDLYLR